MRLPTARAEAVPIFIYLSLTINYDDFTVTQALTGALTGSTQINLRTSLRRYFH